MERNFLRYSQGSVLVPLIFNIFCVTYFLDGVIVTSYADDNTPYCVNNTKDLVIKEIEHLSEFVFQWFDFNPMKNDSGKSHVLFSGNGIDRSIIMPSHLKTRINY